MKRTNKVRLTESQLHRVIKESVKNTLSEIAQPKYGRHTVTDTYYQGNEYSGSKSSNEIDEDIETLANRIEQIYKKHSLSVKVSFRRISEEVPKEDVDVAFDSKKPLNKRRLTHDDNIIIVEMFPQFMDLQKLSNFVEVSKKIAKMLVRYQYSNVSSMTGINDFLQHFINFTDGGISISYYVSKYGGSKARNRVIGKLDTNDGPMSKQVNRPKWLY